MTITRVEKLIYGVENMKAGGNYFRDWGVTEVESGPEQTVFRTRTNQTIELRLADDPSLPPSPDPAKSTLRRAVWGVRDADGLKEMSEDLAHDREVTELDGVLCFADESGNGLGLMLEAPIETDVEIVPHNVNTTEPRMNAVINPAAQANPIRIGHVVYMIEMADREKAVSFYLDRLRFRLSDSTKTGGDFMRCEGGHDHHNLFLVSRADRNAFDHASFEVENFDMVMIGGKFMKEKGWDQDTTPGRHILGSNYYWYFKNPAGGRTEYFADMDRMDDNWKPRIWDDSPGFALWTVDDATS
ncbi:MAG: glyoxalase [Alphaproteobacteria bacterium]|nr:glyoxalase [Alphaproteobacteria bacterium]